MTDSDEIRIMRYMAWERAKGELNALLSAFWHDTEDYIKMQEEVNKFVQKVEDNDLCG